MLPVVARAHQPVTTMARWEARGFRAKLTRMTRLPACLTLVLALIVGCTEDDDVTATGGGGIDWSGAGAGGAGAAGPGGAGNGGSGADGGAATGGAGGMGTGGAGGTGAGGGAQTGTVLVVAVGSTGGITASRVAAGAWSSAALGDSSDHRPALAAFASGDATAMFLSNGTSPGPVRSLTWSGGSFGNPSDYAASAQGAPAYDAVGMVGHLAYHGANFMHYYDQGEAIMPPAGTQSFGPSAPAIAALPGEAAVAFAGDDGSLYAQSRVGGQWQAAVNITGSLAGKPPALAALSGGPDDLLAAWVNHDPGSMDDTKIAYATRNSGGWSTPALIGTAVFTQGDVTLAALSGGDALLAYRGTDGKGYTVRYSGGSWGAPLGLATPSIDVQATPGVSAGVDGHDAEICYAGSDGVAHHMRLSGGSWSASEAIGGTGLVHCAIAAIP